jgi:hypothetical protein
MTSRTETVVYKNTCMKVLIDKTQLLSREKLWVKQISLFIISLVETENISPNKYATKKIYYVTCSVLQTRLAETT